MLLTVNDIVTFPPAAGDSLEIDRVALAGAAPFKAEATVSTGYTDVTSIANWDLHGQATLGYAAFRQMLVDDFIGSWGTLATAEQKTLVRHYVWPDGTSDADLDALWTSAERDQFREEVSAALKASKPTRHGLLPKNHIDDLNISLKATTPDSKVDITAGSCRGDGDGFDITLDSPITLDMAVSGLGGLEGTEAADTLYAVWLFGDSMGTRSTNGVIKAEGSDPTMPYGYDTKRRIGWLLNDASSNFINFIQLGSGRRRRYWWDLPSSPSGSRVLTNGSAGTLTDVDLSAFVPPTAENVILLAEFETGSGGAAADELKLRPDGFSTIPTLWKLRTGTVSGIGQRAQVEIACPGQIIEYRVDSSANNSANLSVAGFDDEV